MTDQACFAGAHIDVLPSRLWQQTGRLVETFDVSPHAEAARMLASGAQPSTTPYAMLCAVNPFRGDGRNGADVIAEITSDMKARGWRGDRMRVAIDEAGRIIVTNGLHRAAAALGAGIPTKCEIVYRHSRWWSLRYALRDLNNGVKLYQAIDHPDFDAWPTWRTDTAARAAAIAAWLREHAASAGTGLDLGCNAGGLTCALGRAGYRMTGLDLDINAIAAAKLLSTMDAIGAPRVRFLCCAAVADVPHASFAVCLSLLNHHQVDGRTEQGHEIFRRLVRAAPVVFIDAPAKGEPVGGDSEFTDPVNVIRWCAASGASGSGREVAQTTPLMRPLIVWTR